MELAGEIAKEDVEKASVLLSNYDRIRVGRIVIDIVTTKQSQDEWELRKEISKT